LAEALEQIIARHTGLRHERVNLVGSEGASQIGRRNRLVWPGADPRFSGISVAALLKLLKQVVQAAAQNATGGTAPE